MTITLQTPASPNPATDESGLVPIRELPLSRCRPSLENDRLYKPIDPEDPTIQALAQSIADRGILEPLVVTLDGWLLSGHRRRAAARLAGLISVPCRVEPIRRADDVDEFVRLLREYNRQREKTREEKFREAVVETDPDLAYETLTQYRLSRSTVAGAPLVITGTKKRAAISGAKKPFLDAVLRVLAARRKFWPLSDRQIHYALLNDPPLIHASKRGSRYANTPESYKALTDLLTRARLVGTVPMEAIGDETRPVLTWSVHPTPDAFVREQLDGFLRGYWRDLMQSQPNHLEIVGEKNTVLSILKPVAADYCIPLTTGRGYCSLPPRNDIACRYKASGKAKLILLILSDFDPDGEEIAHSFARSMRDDLGVTNIHPVKVALTAELVKSHRLPPKLKAKVTSVHYDKFTAKHGDDVYELEALPPETLQAVLREAIDGAIDVDAFNAEVDAERRDAAHLEAVRRATARSLCDATGIGGQGDE